MKRIILNLLHYDKLEKDDYLNIYDKPLLKRAISSGCLSISTENSATVKFRKTAGYKVSMGGQIYVKIDKYWYKIGSNGFCKKLQQIANPSTILSLCSAIGLTHFSARVSEDPNMNVTQMHREAVSSKNRIPYHITESDELKQDLVDHHDAYIDQDPDRLLDVFHHVFQSPETTWLTPKSKEDDGSLLQYTRDPERPTHFYLRIQDKDQVLESPSDHVPSPSSPDPVIVPVRVRLEDPSIVSEYIFERLLLLNHFKTRVSVVCAKGGVGRMNDSTSDQIPVIIERFDEEVVTKSSQVKAEQIHCLEEAMLQLSMVDLVIPDLKISHFVSLDDGSLILSLDELENLGMIKRKRHGMFQTMYNSLFKSFAELFKTTT